MRAIDGVPVRVDPQERRGRRRSSPRPRPRPRRRHHPAEGPGCSRRAARSPSRCRSGSACSTAKLLDPDGVSCGGERREPARLSPAGRPGSAAPPILPDRRSILVTVPRVGSAAKRYRRALASHPGLPPTWIGFPAGRSVVGSSRPTSPRSRSANQTLPAATATPAGEPPTWTRLTDRVAVSIRSTSPASGSVVQTSPPAAASPIARPGDS